MRIKRRDPMAAIPRRELALFDAMERMLDILCERGRPRPRGDSDLCPAWDWTRRPDSTRTKLYDLGIPKTDLIERDDEVLVRAETPGVDKQDLEIDLTSDDLTIKGERRHGKKGKEGELVRSEIVYGAFRRGVRLPEDLDVEKAKAALEDGMLEVCVPKTQQTERRRIEVE